MHIYTEYEDLSDSLKHAYTIQNEFVFKAHNTEEILTGTHKHRTICRQCPIFFFWKDIFLRHGIWQQKRQTTYRPCCGD